MDRAEDQLTQALRLRRPMPRWGDGAVWLAEHLIWQRPVAVQLLAADARDDDGQLWRRFKRFVRVQESIASPRIAPILDSGLLGDGRAYLVLEPLEGASLAHRLREWGPLPLGEVGTLVMQVAQALGVVHRAGVVHGGLHASSVVLLDSQVVLVKLLEVGWTGSDPPRLRSDDAVTDAHAYLSPEQVMETTVDARADVWALGALAYHALTGQLPFEGRSLSALALAICDGRLVPASRLVGGLGSAGASLDDWFERALSKRASSRFASADEALLGWQSACRGQSARELARPAAPAARSPWPLHPMGWDADEETKPLVATRPGRFPRPEPTLEDTNLFVAVDWAPNESDVRAVRDDDPLDFDDISDFDDVSEVG